MKKFLVLVLSGVLLILAGCKSDSDVLATFKGGEITRGEFNSWMDARHLPKDAILKKKSQQEKKIQSMVLDELTVNEAIKAGYDKSKDYNFLLDLQKAAYYSGMLKKNISSDSSFKEEVVKVRLIKLFVRNYKLEKNKRIKLTDAELEKDFQKKTEEAKSIIEELKSGKKFEELAKNHSDDYSKKKGGDIGYISKGMRGEEFSKVAFSLKTGEYTKEPVRIGNGIYILKIEDRAEVTENNIEDIIEDKNIAGRLKRRLVRSAGQNFEKQLNEAKDVEVHIDQISNKDVNTVLFKIGNDEYKISNLNELIDFISKKRGGSKNKNNQINDKLKSQMANKLFNEKLMYREAIKRELDKDPEIANGWSVAQKSILALSYKRYIIFAGITVSPSEVREDYNKNKDRIYAKKEKKGNKVIKTTQPFNVVKDRIESVLLNRKRSLKRKEWEDALIKKSNYSINKDKLEGE